MSPEMEQSAYFRQVFRENPYITLLRDLAPSDPYIGLSGYLPGVVSTDGRKMSWRDDFQAVRGDLFFAEDEITFARRAVDEARSQWQKTHSTQPAPPLVVLHPWAKRRQLYASGRVKEYQFAANKEWASRSIKAAAKLTDRAMLVQFMPKTWGQPRLESGTKSCLNFRQAAAMLNSATSRRRRRRIAPCRAAVAGPRRHLRRMISPKTRVSVTREFTWGTPAPVAHFTSASTAGLHGPDSVTACSTTLAARRRGA